METKASEFLGDASMNSIPPLPSEMWEMVKQGFEAKMAIIAKDAERQARNDERRKYREKATRQRMGETCVAAVNSDAISNAVTTISFGTRYAHRSPNEHVRNCCH